MSLLLLWGFCTSFSLSPLQSFVLHLWLQLLLAASLVHFRTFPKSWMLMRIWNPNMDQTKVRLLVIPYTLTMTSCCKSPNLVLPPTSLLLFAWPPCPYHHPGLLCVPLPLIPFEVLMILLTLIKTCSFLCHLMTTLTLQHWPQTCPYHCPSSAHSF